MLPLPTLQSANPIADWYWLLALLLLFVLLILIWRWKNRRGHKPSRTMAKPSIRAAQPIAPPMRSKASTTPNLTQEWVTERTRDDLDRAVKVRFSPAAHKVQSDLRHGLSSKIRLRIDDQSKTETLNMARATFIIEISEEFDPITDDRTYFYRARIQEFEVKEAARQRGIDLLLLRKVEELAQEHGAQEIYSQTLPDRLQFFFTKQEYQSRQGRQRKEEIFKVLDKLGLSLD